MVNRKTSKLDNSIGFEGNLNSLNSTIVHTLLGSLTSNNICLNELFPKSIDHHSG